jgi:hypothetical protein
VNLYITRNGERLGPYSPADVQGFLAAGTLHANDWAWYEGLAGWVPLYQVPGFAATSPPSSTGRPVLVWIISFYYFICTPIGLLGLAMMPFLRSLVLSPSAHLPEGQRAYFESLNGVDYGLGLINSALSLTAAIFLFRLRRPALYFFAAVFILGVFIQVYSMVAKNWFAAVGLMGLVTAPIIWALQVALLGYVWHLYRKGVLR